MVTVRDAVWPASTVICSAEKVISPACGKIDCGVMEMNGYDVGSLSYVA